MRKSVLFLHKMRKCSLCLNPKMHGHGQKACSLSMSEHSAAGYVTNTSSFSCNSSGPINHSRLTKKILLQDDVHNAKHQSRHYCTKDFDVKNDPETRSLMNEIISDFESVKKSQKDNEAQSDHSIEEKENSFEKKIEEDSTDDTMHKSVQTEIEDVEEFEEELVDPAWVPPISLKRGESGVFELDELVTLLEKENGQNIAVIEIPPEARFADHMVIVSALSVRHLRSMSSRVKWTHKQKKGEEDASLSVEGFDTAPDWHAMDLGNIILHLFLPDTRELYDLETLWTNWGKPGQVEKDDDPYTISPEDDFWSRLEPQHGTEDKKDPK